LVTQHAGNATAQYLAYATLQGSNSGYSVQTDSWSDPSSCSVGTGVSSSR